MSDRIDRILELIDEVVDCGNQSTLEPPVDVGGFDEGPVWVEGDFYERRIRFGDEPSDVRVHVCSDECDADQHVAADRPARSYRLVGELGTELRFGGWTGCGWSGGDYD